MPQTVLSDGSIVGKVQCQGEEHRVLLSSKGKIVLPCHSREDLEAEWAMQALGDGGCGCVQAVKAWREAVDCWFGCSGREAMRLWRRAESRRLPRRREPKRSRRRGLRRQSIWRKPERRDALGEVLDRVPVGFEHALRAAWDLRRRRGASEWDDDVIDAEFATETPMEIFLGGLAQRTHEQLCRALRACKYFGNAHYRVTVDATRKRGARPKVKGKAKDVTYRVPITVAARVTVAARGGGKREIPTFRHRRIHASVDPVSYCWMRWKLGGTATALDTDGKHRVALLKLIEPADAGSGLQPRSLARLPADAGSGLQPRSLARLPADAGSGLHGGSMAAVPADAERGLRHPSGEAPGARPNEGECNPGARTAGGVSLRWVAWAARRHGIWHSLEARVVAERCIIYRSCGFQWSVEKWLAPARSDAPGGP